MKSGGLFLLCAFVVLQHPLAGRAEDPPRAAERIASFGRELASSRDVGTYVDCPLGVYRALAMLWAGAKNETADQIARVLDDPGGAQLWSDLDALQGALPVTTRERLWIQDGYPIAPAYVEFLGRHGLEAPGSADFGADPEKCREQINRWAAEATRGRVSALFPAGAFSGVTRAVLAGTVFFRGRWEKAFDPDQTRSEIFHGLAGDAPIPLMHRKGRWVYAENPEWQVVGLPFDDRATELIVALPAPDSVARPDGFGALAAWTAAGQKREVDLFLPRFSVSSSLELSARLAEMGMPDAFSRDRADFSGVNPELYLAGVFQGVSVAVDESGAVAAAGAGAVLNVKSMAFRAPPPVVFRADRPFFFYIRNAASGLIYFSGRLADAPEAPAAAED